jgi:RNA polymerase sigma-70 factor (ECF subfamily)
MSDSIDPLDALVLRAQAGDHEAFVSMVEQTEHDLRVVVSCYATNLTMVDEVMQGTYVTAFERLSSYQPRATLRPWLVGIARNLIRRELSQRSKALAMDGEILEQVLARQAHQRLEQDDEHVPEQEAAVLRRCLEQLAPEARQLITERYITGMAVNDIATLLTRSANWVAVSLFRIRKTLHVCLRQGGIS